MSIQIIIQFNGKQLTIPINPESITIERSAENNDMDIIGLGKTTRKGEPSLRKLTIESFFPAQNTYFYTGVKPKTCIEFIEEIWNTENTNNNVAKIVTIGLPIDINMFFVIDSFNYDHKAGEEDDIYYNLAIKEYKAYGVKTVDVQLSGLASARAVSPVVVSQDAPAPEVETKTYTVQKGDCLFNITKACTGNGNNWRELYNLNKEVIGNNPNLIYPGQVLTLPQGWNTPSNVTKLKATSKSKSNSSKTSKTGNSNNAPSNGVSKNVQDPRQSGDRIKNMQAKINAYKSGIVIPTRPGRRRRRWWSLMKLELYIQNSNDGTVYDIADITEQVQVSQTLDGDAGKLTCILQKDPNNKLQIANGSIISFIVNGKGFFFGYVFKIGTDANQNYKITCYDQLRYLKNSDVYTTANMTASQIFEKICQDYGLRYEVKVPSYYKPEPYVHDNKTLYTIIKRGIDLADINEKAQYFIADRFGTLTWSEYSYEKTNIQLGDGSLMTSYQYEKSIDEDTYNQIKIYRDNKETGKRDIWIVKDSDNLKRWGTLQFLKKADDDANSSQVRQTAESYLKVKNRETETLKLEAEGIPELTIGRGVKFVLPREGIDKWLWIKSCTHTFTKYSHTMDLELEV